MSTASFYMVHISSSIVASDEDVKKIMNLALDWYQVSENLWILYSTSDAKKWYARLKPVINEDGRVFICVLNTADRSGWMSRSFWNWLKKDRRAKT